MAAQALVGFKLATGIYLDSLRLVATQVTSTPLGVKPGETVEEPVVDGDVAGALARLRETGRLKCAVVFGIDPRRSFAIARKLSPDEAQRRPVELLAARLGFAEDNLVAGKESVKLPGGGFTVLTACPRALVQQLLEGLGPGRHAHARLASVNQALYEQSLRLKPRSRRNKTEVRVLPGEGTGLALLAHGGTLVAGRLFGMSGHDDSSAIALAVRSLLTHAHEELGLVAVDLVLLHAGEDAADAATACEEGYGIPTQAAPLLSPDAVTASAALAQSAARPRANAIDLFEELRPPPGVRQIFPIKAACLLLAVLAGGSWMIHSEASALEGENAKLKQLTDKYAKKAKVNPKDLVKVHDALKTEFGVAAAFITSRVFWSDVLRELPAVMPPTGTVIDLDGRDLVRFPSKKKKSEAAPTSGSRQLMLAIEVPLDEADSSPPEVAVLTDSLRASAYFQQQFPRVTGANVRLLPAIKGLAARIMVMCFPQAKA